MGEAEVGKREFVGQVAFNEYFSLTMWPPNTLKELPLLREAGDWRTFLQSMQEDLQVLRQEANNVVLDRVAIAILRKLRGFWLAEHRFAFLIGDGECPLLSSLRADIAEVLEAQFRLRRATPRSTRSLNVFSVCHSARAVAQAFHSLLNHWYSLETVCLGSTICDKERQQAAENNTWQRLLDRTIYRLYATAPEDRYICRRLTLNSVSLPLIILKIALKRHQVCSVYR